MAIPAVTAFSTGNARNVFIPGYDPSSQARIIIDYVLNPKKFSLNNWVHVHPVTKIVGVYPKILAQDAIRVPFDDGSDAIWTDGTPSSAGVRHDGGVRRTNITYELERFRREGNVGHIQRDQSDFDEIKLEQNQLTSIQMTFRTIAAIKEALTTGNYPTNHTATATALGGNTLDQGTINNPIIKKCLDAIRDRIFLDTNGMVELDDLNLILSPTLASTLSRSQEIRAYLAQQGRSYEVIKGETPDAKNSWSLPNPLYGFRPVIEKTPKVTTKRNQLASGSMDGTPEYCMPGDQILIAARPGSLVSEDGAANFSTVHILELKGQAFKVFMKDYGDEHKLTYIRVEDFFKVIIPAPESGYILTGCV